MKAIIFCGIQASGKTSFYKEQFLKTHVRISLDLLNTRRKEKIFLEACLANGQAFVLDNTNPTMEQRRRYIELFKSHKFEVIGYYFQSEINSCLQRNLQRQGNERIPELGMLSTYAKLEIPSYDEGFDLLYYVTLKNNLFEIKQWKDEV